MSVKVPTNVNNVRQNSTHISMNDNKTSLAYFTVGFHANWGDLNALKVKLNYPADSQNSPVIDYGFGCILIGRALELTAVVTFDGRTSVFLFPPTTNRPPSDAARIPVGDTNSIASWWTICNHRG